ncbi:MAG: hypothetical protein M9894_39670 [Planctomycetes bacterium]|nr:hypothetical protein [Planctomycetota bacterium]
MKRTNTTTLSAGARDHLLASARDAERRGATAEAERLRRLAAPEGSAEAKADPPAPAAGGVLLETARAKVAAAKARGDTPMEDYWSRVLAAEEAKVAAAPRAADPPVSAVDLVRLSGGKVRPSVAEAMAPDVRATLGASYRLQGLRAASDARMHARLDAVEKSMGHVEASLGRAEGRAAPSTTRPPSGATAGGTQDEAATAWMHQRYPTAEAWWAAVDKLASEFVGECWVGGAQPVVMEKLSAKERDEFLAEALWNREFQAWVVAGRPGWRVGAA